jgi:glycosyltransferase involved in cell wall biosynthesis
LHRTKISSIGTDAPRFQLAIKRATKFLGRFSMRGQQAELFSVGLTMLPAANSHVAILLATKNGARFVGEQLRSFAQQTHEDWSLHVSDDGSEDTTLDILRDFSDRCSQSVKIVGGPRCGAAANFMSLAWSDIDAPFFAFSDQDDIWLPNKLSRALGQLAELPADMPAMYCARTEIVDVDGKHVRFSPELRRGLSFENALAENVASGNTIVFNRATKMLLERLRSLPFAAHDWAIYQIVTAVRGVAILDREPCLKYRQHERNHLGSNAGLDAKLMRLRLLFKDTLKEWNDLNTTVLDQLKDRMGPTELDVLTRFQAARHATSPIERLRLLRESRVRRQTRLGNLGMQFAAISGKL